jgi:hypothetical protein
MRYWLAGASVRFRARGHVFSVLGAFFCNRATLDPKGRLRLLHSSNIHMKYVIIYRFLNAAGRFSTKAFMPSFWSSVAKSEWKMRRSKRTPSASVVS